MAHRDPGGYGPDPRSRPFREGHRAQPERGEWPASRAHDLFHDDGGNGYARRYYGDEARPGVGRAEGLDLGDGDDFYRFREMPRRGPKGYVRSDERILEDVCERLSRRRDLDVGEVSVAVEQGEVKLEGEVPDRGMKHRIEDLCADCRGVSDVDNRLRVVRGA